MNSKDEFMQGTNLFLVPVRGVGLWEQISGVVTIPSQHLSLGQDLCGRQLQCSLLYSGGRRCPCSWPNFVPLEESSDSAWGSLRTKEERESRPKGKGGHPWGVEVFTTPPFVLYFHFPWLIAGESESRVCLFCNLLRVFVNIFVSH